MIGGQGSGVSGLNLNHYIVISGQWSVDVCVFIGATTNFIGNRIF